MSESAAMTIRSFRVCFRVERRIHKIDQWRIPLPFGLPLRGAAYAIGLLMTVLFVGNLPLIGAPVHAMPIPLRYAIVPVGGAFLLTRWEPDGRAAHVALLAYARMLVSPSRLAAFRPAPLAQGPVRLGSVTVVPDERSARMRRAVVEGPAEIVLRYPFASRTRRQALEITPQDGPPRWRGKQVQLQSGQRVVIR